MPHVTLERFNQGMTFAQYLDYIGSAANLAREANQGAQRRDMTSVWRDSYDAANVDAYQVEAFRALMAQPGGPARALVISEDWSSDCQREVPTIARLGEATGLEVRVFNRDGSKFGGGAEPVDSGDGNADLVGQFLNHKNGATFQSVPVIAFFTQDMQYLYHFTEYAAIYDKDRVVIGHIRAPRDGETAQQTQERGDREFGELRRSAIWRIWARAAIDEMISALHRRETIGSV